MASYEKCGKKWYVSVYKNDNRVKIFTTKAVAWAVKVEIELNKNNNYYIGNNKQILIKPLKNPAKPQPKEAQVKN